ncbi:hypothetical protein LAZ67_5001524 [Cordylochernes scorpioides]|uniref:Uncharacterized protein n=1 Tax=Cordylochernes scorpioides TaxID=51811 RepID=A0ABY6KIN4_9ARAC|nr:hypothetical protein LAZ67_5001524 [Cordylochernes scorpioides]
MVNSTSLAPELERQNIYISTHQTRGPKIFAVENGGGDSVQKRKREEDIEPPSKIQHVDKEINGEPHLSEEYFHFPTAIKKPRRWRVLDQAMSGSSTASPSPTWTKVAINSQLCRCQDGKGVVLKAGPAEDPSLQVRGPPYDVEGLSDERLMERQHQ